MFFYLILFTAWWFTKLLWGKKVANYSLILLIPIGLLVLPIIWNDPQKGIFGASFIFALVFSILFVIVNFIAMIIEMIRNLNLKDPDVQQALISGLASGVSGKSLRKSSRSSDEIEDEYGTYVIQYRQNNSWIDGPGSNDERVAESMYDQFLQNDPRSMQRCRLVYKVRGRVKSVMSTN